MRIEGHTDNGIAYNSDTSGPNGAHYYLFPVKGKHSDEHILRAKWYLKYNFDVVSTIIMSYEQDTDESVKYICSHCGSEKVITTLKGVNVYVNDLRIRDAHKKKAKYNFCNSCSKYVKLVKQL